MHDHDWDETYSESEAMWSGNPNAALVAEASKLSPGLALDVGSGEGADAIWLEQQGWEVVGLEPSSVAIERATRAMKAAGVEVEWVHGELGSAFLPHAEYDLVTASYVPLFTDAHTADLLTSLVAPGGHLLVVHHADFDTQVHADHPAYGRELLSPELISEQLPDGWGVITLDNRERAVTHGAGAQHRDDVVLVAQRLN
ncbi:bifunctional 2-polyprenyl-6-hydroxyphenol methylase/3-demethylubiquinol 3-O-methyltransferase UbiG [Tessaracoccus sp. MC1756]|uniref:class I SAM-dependent methyltransferase n=1 Tax=Tessaracoccus sp. MC1756 TaxID=2760311 RepID=UPI0016004C42|nr:class I SAM-dependent methyltransferase [Tessaracoccus sp. MC1756]MBB1508362.1 class I SAM-dependent methyltransferase [Tessaracoccus sp. MC1756]